MTTTNEQAAQALDIATFTDERGTLRVIDFNRGDTHRLPFNVGRVFWIDHVPEGAVRGAHAHQSCWEALVAVKGQFSVRVEDGHGTSTTFRLDNPSEALIIPPLVWCELSNFSQNAVCLCLASGSYDPDGYLCDRDEFADFVNTEGKAH